MPFIRFSTYRGPVHRCRTAVRRLLRVGIVAAFFPFAAGTVAAGIRGAERSNDDYARVLARDGEWLRSRRQERLALDRSPDRVERYRLATDSLYAHVNRGRPQPVNDFRDDRYRVVVPPRPVLDYRNAVTVSVWLFLEAPKMVAQSKIVSHAGVSSGKLTLMGSGRRIELMLRYANGASDLWTGDRKIPVRTWCHVAATYSAASGPALFIDAEKCSLRRQGSGPPAGGPILSLPDQPLYIGGFDRAFPGCVDDVRLYGRALPPHDVRTLARGEPVPDGLIGWWPFDETGSTQARDRSGHGLDGRIGERLQAGRPGRLGRCISFGRDAARWSRTLRRLEARVDAADLPGSAMGRAGGATKAISSGETGRANAEELGAVLRRNQAVLVHYVTDPRTGSLRAWVLAPGKLPVSVHLSDVSRVSVAAKLCSDAFRMRRPRRRDEARYRQIARVVSRAVWDPVEPYLSAACTVWLRLPPCLSDIPFAALVDSSGAYLVESYAFARCGPVGELARRRNRDSGDLRVHDPSQLRIVAVADPRFHDIGDGRHERTPSGSRGTGRFRADPSDDCIVRGTALPGTSYEVEQLAKLGARAGCAGTSLLRHENAREENVAATWPGRHVVHVATHGYRIEEGCLPAIPADPLALSGVVLAGASRLVPDDSRGRFEGLLSAAEVARMDLSRCWIAVWSGCETARGYALPRESLRGLAAATWLAGAGASLSTLWRVSDRVMPVQIEAFYASWFDRKPVEQALQDALRRGMRKARTERGNTHPAYWAAVVLEGL